MWESFRKNLAQNLRKGDIVYLLLARSSRRIQTETFTIHPLRAVEHYSTF